MLTGDFATAFGELRAVAETSRTAIMCAEALPWRCHRRLIADQFLAEGWEVHDIIGAETLNEGNTVAARSGRQHACSAQFRELNGERADAAGCAVNQDNLSARYFQMVVDALERQFPGMKQRLCRGDSLAPGLQVAIGDVMTTRGLRATLRT